MLIKVVFLEVTYNKGFDVGVEGNYTFNNETGTRRGDRQLDDHDAPRRHDRDKHDHLDHAPPTSPHAALAAERHQRRQPFRLFARADRGSFVRAADRRLVGDAARARHAGKSGGAFAAFDHGTQQSGSRDRRRLGSAVHHQQPHGRARQPTNTITYDNVGIILRVTPFITSEGTVEMIVAPEISSLTAQTVPISSTVSAPVIDKRSAETVVVTPHGQTVVIGGLMETQRIEDIQKIPLLGDIPLLGAAFRRTIKTT